VGGSPDHVGPTTLKLEDGTERQIDVLVAADDAPSPSERSVLALGKAKAGERISMGHLHRLEPARAALGERAAGARLLLFGIAHDSAVAEAAAARMDIELIDLQRLYGGA
jgi:hypothetical protein